MSPDCPPLLPDQQTSPSSRHSGVRPSPAPAHVLTWFPEGDCICHQTTCFGLLQQLQDHVGPFCLVVVAPADHQVHPQLPALRNGARVPCPLLSSHRSVMNTWEDKNRCCEDQPGFYTPVACSYMLQAALNVSDSAITNQCV